ncbi:MAG: type IV pilus modification PilV family protein [Acidimicrobiales bacterium]
MTRLRRRRAGEDGFTLIEVSIASGVMLVALSAMAQTSLVGLVDVAYGRQRQAATALANQSLENLRALPFDTVRAGLDHNDLATNGPGDPEIVVSGTPATYTFRGEVIPAGDNAAVTPLVPYRRSVTVGSTEYAVATYLTAYTDGAVVQPDVFRATAIVTWRAARGGGTGQVEVQSLYSLLSAATGGCQPVQAHPLPGPCEPFFAANATQSPAGIRIQGTVAGLALVDAEVGLGEANAAIEQEQMVSVSGLARSPGVTLRLLDGTVDQTLGRHTAASSSSTDPARGRPVYDAVTTSPSAGGALNAGLLNTVRLTAGAGDEARSTSTVSANDSTRPCTGPTGLHQNDGLACARSSHRQAAAAGASLNLGTLGLMNLVSVGVTPAATVAYANYDAAGGGATCTATNGDGCMHASVTRRLGDVRIGDLPLGILLKPLGWQGHLVRLTGYADQVSVEAGPGSAAPAASASGTLEVWNGTGYTTIALLGAGGFALPVASVNIALLGIEISASLSTGGTSTASDPSPCAGCTRAAAEASSASPLTGTLRVRVGALADVSLTIDLGTISARTAYRGDPGA